MAGTYNPWLVLLSLIVATTASFVALDSTSRMAASRARRARWYWLAGGALSMGTGIWSMHFIGMLAFRLPIPTSYDLRITLLSLLTAVVASTVALLAASRNAMNSIGLLWAGCLAGAAIASMHYIGMSAMRMQPPIEYSPGGVALSILVGVAASTLSVWSAFRLRLDMILTAFGRKAGSAVAMGGGICGMHYTGMASARFAPGSVCTVTPLHIESALLGATLGGFALLFMSFTLLIAAYDAHVSAVLDQRVAERTQRLDQITAELRRLMERLANVQDEERRRIAAELHDIVGQNVSALSIEIAAIRNQLDPAPGSELADWLASASALAKQSVEAIRAVMVQLRPPGSDAVGLPPALRWHADAFQARTGITVTLTLDETLPKPSPAVEDALLRICAEALNNVARHASAHAVVVKLEQRADQVALEIGDDGGGFDAEKPAARKGNSGWGLVIMRERAQAIGAKLGITSAPGAGTRVELLIPKDRWR